MNDIMDTFKLWIDAIHPDKYEKILKGKKKGKFLLDAVMIIAAASVLSLVVGIFITVVNILSGGSISDIASGGFNNLFLLVVVSFVLEIGVFSFNQYILMFLAGFLGGKGKIDNQAYSLALIGAGITLVSSILSLIGIVPCLGAVISVIGSVILGFWGLFLQYKILKTIHKLSRWKTIALIILDSIIWFVIIFILVLLALGIFGPALVESITNNMYGELLA